MARGCRCGLEMNTRPTTRTRLYGTANVVIALRDLRNRGHAEVEPMLRARTALAGRAHRTTTTAGAACAALRRRWKKPALAVEALAGTEHVGATDRGAAWLVERVESDTWREPAPIGFYFAKLWYYERLYPQIFAVGALGKVVALSRAVITE